MLGNVVNILLSFLKKVHYARYGTFFYVLENLDMTHPGAKEELKHVGKSVRQNPFGIVLAIDMASEQAFMKGGKTVGGITNFNSRPETVRKWVLNRLFQYNLQKIPLW